MQKLKGCLNVVELHDVFEDDEYVYIVMETCAGGELHDRIGEAHYSERTVRLEFWVGGAQGAGGRGGGRG